MAYMPCIPLAVKLPETADLRQAARYLGAPGEPDEQTLALLRRCAPPLMAACRARAVYRQLSTADLAQTGLLQGQDIARHLAGCTGGVLLERERMPWLLRWQSKPPMRRKSCWCSTIRGRGCI